jgi:hypothetical protein
MFVIYYSTLTNKQIIIVIIIIFLFLFADVQVHRTCDVMY